MLQSFLSSFKSQLRTLREEEGEEEHSAAPIASRQGDIRDLCKHLQILTDKVEELAETTVTDFNRLCEAQCDTDSKLDILNAKLDSHCMKLSSATASMQHQSMGVHDTQITADQTASANLRPSLERCNVDLKAAHAQISASRTTDTEQKHQHTSLVWHSKCSHLLRYAHVFELELRFKALEESHAAYCLKTERRCLALEETAASRALQTDKRHAPLKERLQKLESSSSQWHHIMQEHLHLGGGLAKNIALIEHQIQLLQRQCQEHVDDFAAVVQDREALANKLREELIRLSTVVQERALRTHEQGKRLQDVETSLQSNLKRIQDVEAAVNMTHSPLSVTSLDFSPRSLDSRKTPGSQQDVATTADTSWLSDAELMGA
eukprot:gnl/TRDRNA2_/TRDRNA2_177193_c0_seq7.p1 gnl/TRDRNA2_/TRDRNA2_177193_c0~~gnl/TRDRNA2_/TRDRNA2_177193_c0_seq7.p1  ORF type:complete len:377 (-),score=66.90 gnl/TRDRNA2_/TRDRNA2_177193_c0_seq7:86-1216(-)